MRYDAVCHYADSDHAKYSKFNLPVIPPAAPLPNETVRVRPRPNKNIVSGSVSEAVVDDATIYATTKPEDWYIVKGKQRGRNVGPIEYIGKSGQFEVNVTVGGILAQDQKISIIPDHLQTLELSSTK